MDVLAFEQDAPKPTPEDVTHRLRDAIGRGLLPPGLRLAQEDLATRMGVSRMPVREALRRLESEGLVTALPNCGARVAALTAAELNEIYEMRVALETLAIRAASPHYTPAVFDTLRTLLGCMDDGIEDMQEYLLLNKRFHDLLYGQAQRPILLHTLENLRLRSDRYLALFSLTAASTDHAQNDHWEILQAVERGDLASACSVLTQHLHFAADGLSALLASPRVETS